MWVASGRVGPGRAGVCVTRRLKSGSSRCVKIVRVSSFRLKIERFEAKFFLQNRFISNFDHDKSTNPTQGHKKSHAVYSQDVLLRQAV